MSSHHIIREKQEPALLIADINRFDPEYLGQLLEWSPTVMVLQKEVEKVASLAIKIDVIITQNTFTEEIQEHTRLVFCEGKTEREAALDFLQREQYHAINIIINEFDFVLFSKYINAIDIVQLNEQERCFTAKPGFSKWKPAGEKVRIASLTSHLSVEGLSLISENLYQTTKDGLYKLYFDNDLIWIAENL